MQSVPEKSALLKCYVDTNSQLSASSKEQGVLLVTKCPDAWTSYRA